MVQKYVVVPAMRLYLFQPAFAQTTPTSSLPNLRMETVECTKSWFKADGTNDEEWNLFDKNGITYSKSSPGTSIDPRDEAIRLFGGPIFNDVPADEEIIAIYIRIAYDFAIMDGYPDGTFRSNDPVKGAELAKILYNTYRKDTVRTGTSLSNNQTPD